MSEAIIRQLTMPQLPTAEMADEMSDIELLHSISVALIGEQDRAELYGKIVDAAIAITQSQYGTMQILGGTNGSPSRGLHLLCSRGLPPEAEAFWQFVPPTALSSCTVALRSKKRAVISDYESWDEIAGTEDLLAFRKSGIRSAQTTPLLSRDGILLGMISTHWSKPHEPTARDLRMLDILARQAADLLERTIADEALRDREKELEKTVAALRETEELQKMLTGELSHRVKNMLATVQAIASQTLRHTESPADFVQGFSGRIGSMSRVHSQLSTNDWRGTQLRDVVDDQMKLGPVDETQITASGPDVLLDATAVPKIAMILHELGTNSLKYGALSVASGSVKIAWTLDGQKLQMIWTEHGGPTVEAPVRRGFGSRLVETSVRGDGGSASMTVDSGGVRWDIVFPLPQGAGGSDEPSIQARESRNNHSRKSVAASSLAGKRVLVVEDEPLLGMEVVGQLEDAGVHVVGPAGTPSQAIRLIEEARLDAALLDANLDGAPVGEIATALANLKVPFAFVSGYGTVSLPKGFDQVPLLSKPNGQNAVLEAVRRLVDGARER